MSLKKIFKRSDDYDLKYFKSMQENEIRHQRESKMFFELLEEIQEVKKLLNDLEIYLIDDNKLKRLEKGENYATYKNRTTAQINHGRTATAAR